MGTTPDRTRTWGQPLWIGWAQLLGAVGLAVVLAGTDPAGRLLLVPVIVLAAASGLRDLLLAPVLTAGPEGLSVVSGAHRRTAAWSQVERVRVVTDRRVPLLELDLGDTVVVLSRRRLGADVEEVRQALVEVRT